MLCNREKYVVILKKKKKKHWRSWTLEKTTLAKYWLLISFKKLLKIKIFLAILLLFLTIEKDI